MIGATPLPAANPRSLVAIGERLRLTRQALGLRQAALCRRTGIAPNTYNQWEKATIRPSLDQALRLVDEFGLTLDWIYLGATAALPAELAARISAERGPRPKTSPRRKIRAA